MVLSTKRLLLREMTEEDFPDLCEILQDAETMRAYEHAFSDEEAHAWLNTQMARYIDRGYGLWAVISEETGEFLGQCGLTIQSCDDEKVLEIGYLFKRKHWHHGYALEAAQMCKAYAFKVLDASRVYSIIRHNNLASQRVAIRNGMLPVHIINKHYYNVDMPHLVFMVERPADF